MKSKWIYTWDFVEDGCHVTIDYLACSVSEELYPLMSISYNSITVIL